ncbi:MAG: HipA domain-containing protein [Candidatus Binatus sp.]|uniref:type II toxin-antitoxin system HipA family toxin n=1 Tax=Candidatus Binatus sp. TaxID=2811406 RepID=UPI003C7850A3
MEKIALVYVDLDGIAHPAGRLWARARGGKESASFEYDKSWLKNPLQFSVEPALQLGPGPYHTANDLPMFGAIGDSAPDRWGRALMRRMERRRADREKQTPRTLFEMDYLLLVDDQTRAGALRFKLQETGPFLRESAADGVPPLVELSKLLAASERVIDEDETDEDLRLLIAPGSSLGGARPKASVRERDGRLAVAKFPRKDDEISTVLWESVALQVAGKAGIAVAASRVEQIARKPVLIVDRFDRAGRRRIPFLSAMSMLAAKDNETRSYLELADALRRYGAAPKDDLEALWRRIVLNILISNTDDHLRNHGFLYAGANGWRLSPAYDLNPVPTDVKPRVLTTAINEADGTASLDLALTVAGYFDVEGGRARQIAKEVAQAVKGWRSAAAKAGIKDAEMDRVASAFEHDDLQRALKG